MSEHLLAAIFHQRGASGILLPYSIWRIDQIGRPRGFWTVDDTWNEATVQKYDSGWAIPKPLTYKRQADAVKEARRAAKLSDLGVDVKYRSFGDLFGPDTFCAICGTGLLNRGWEASICAGCRANHEHGLRALGDKQAYMVGPHPGNGRALEGHRYLYPLPDLLAALAGSVIREKHSTPAERFGGSPKMEAPKETLGARREGVYWGGDLVVDLTPAQAAAWNAAVEWIQAEIERAERVALDQGTRLLTGLASGKLSPEDFEPQIIQLRKGRPLR